MYGDQGIPSRLVSAAKKTDNTSQHNKCNSIKYSTINMILTTLFNNTKVFIFCKTTTKYNNPAVTYLIISCNKVLSFPGLVEVWVHRNSFDWAIQVDHLIVFITIETTDDHLETQTVPVTIISFPLKTVCK